MSEKFCLTGSPRVDLWKKRFQSYWENNLDSKSKYILISSNFGVVNSNVAIWKKYYELRKAGYFERNKFLEIIIPTPRIQYKTCIKI